MQRCAAIALAVLAAATAGKAEEAWPMTDWEDARPHAAGMDPAGLAAARKVALAGGGAGCVVRGGRRVTTWGPQKRRYDLKSTTKSIGVTAVGLALADGKFEGLDDPAAKHHPHFRAAGKDRRRADRLGRITLFHLATHTAGFAKPGGSETLLFDAGRKWHYSDSGPNWLAECVTLAYGKDVRELLFERVFGPIGITAKDLSWRRNAYRGSKIAGVARREFGSGISANVDAMARIGLLYLRGGRWGRRQLVPKAFVEAAAATPTAIRGLGVVGGIGAAPAAPNHYGLLWWNNRDGAMPDVPRDAFFSWGLHDSHIVVVPSLDLVVARAGQGWKRAGRTDYETLAGFLRPICASAGARAPGRAPRAKTAGPPPPSPVIRGVTWAAPETIVRRARGSDNWPITWGDDGALYTAYGDGWGFEPKVPGKLSLGLAKVTGTPPRIQGVNLRSPTAEQTGDGAGGRKASGLLMVDGVLYMWVRNADGRGRQSQLAVSKDHGRTWTWPRWRLAELGYPCFLNFGRDYAGARDRYAYVYSPDTPSAYEASDAVVLARVPADRIAERGAYEFFAGPGGDDRPAWSRDICRRKPVLTLPGGCNRLSAVHDAPLKRYLMTMRSRGRGGRFSLFDAPEPWGPWTTAFTTTQWDTDPGESQHIPARWIGPDGRTFHLVFSGGDSFSVRRGRLQLARP